jgi:hypothetical protein
MYLVQVGHGQVSSVFTVCNLEMRLCSSRVEYVDLLLMQYSHACRLLVENTRRPVMKRDVMR